MASRRSAAPHFIFPRERAREREIKCSSTTERSDCKPTKFVFDEASPTRSISNTITRRVAVTRFGAPANATSTRRSKERPFCENEKGDARGRTASGHSALSLAFAIREMRKKKRARKTGDDVADRAYRYELFRHRRSPRWRYFPLRPPPPAPLPGEAPNCGEKYCSAAIEFSCRDYRVRGIRATVRSSYVAHATKPQNIRKSRASIASSLSKEGTENGGFWRRCT